MRRLFYGAVLVFSVFVVVSAQNFDNELGSDFDLDWFWIGSDLRSIGNKPLNSN